MTGSELSQQIARLENYIEEQREFIAELEGQVDLAYQTGYDDGYDYGREETHTEAYQDGYSDGYETARADIGQNLEDPI